MFEIKYNFSDNDTEELLYPDEKSLRYNHYRGNLILQNGKDSIFIDWNRTPLIDFSLSILQICNVLLEKRDAGEEFEFTETNEKIAFEKNNDKVKIIPSFSIVTLEIDFEEFRKAIKKYYKTFALDVISKNQSLRINVLLLNYLYEAERL